MPSRPRLSLVVSSLCAAAVTSLLPAAPAHAATVPWQIAAVQNTYVVGDLVILQGDSLTFTNADLTTHDIVSIDNGPSGPLFRSAIVGPGKQTPVAGVSSLPVGTWPFICSLHEFMSGTIDVRAV
jgi:plastocyanin